MANRNNRQQGGNRRMDFGRLDRKGYGRPIPAPVSPWQQGPSAAMGGVLPLASSSEATLALANNLINNLLQARQAAVPSLLDMPIRRDFVGDPNRGFDRGFNRMSAQPNYRRGPGNYVRPSDRPNYRRNFKPNDGQKNKQGNKKDNADSKQKQVKTESVEPEKKESEEKDGASKDSPIKEEVKDEPAGEASAPAADEKKEGDDKEAEKKDGEKKEAPKTAYDGINPALLHCHICNKVMWDGRSFENHLNGRAHHIMMQKTNESYVLTADTMRQELKIREMKHYRKLGQNGPRNFFCTMCDMYAADGSTHRTTLGHRKLKKYLHPTCTSCHKEMPTRIDLDEHRLSPEHLLAVQGRRKDFTTKPKAEGIQTLVISTLNTEESYVRFDRKDHGKRGRESNAGEKEKEEGGVDVKVEEKSGEEEEDKTILDWKEGDDMSEVTPDMIPRYMPERGVGRSFLGEFTCVQCKLCRKLLDSQETAEVHLRTWRHHLLFVKHLQRKAKPQDTQTDLGKRASADEEEDDSSSSKRRKTTADNVEDDGATNGDHDEDYEELEDEELEGGDEGAEGNDVDMKEQELWEKDLALIMNDVTADQEAAKQVTEEPVPEEAPVVKETSAEPSPSVSPSKAKGTRGRGRGRGRAKRV